MNFPLSSVFQRDNAPSNGEPLYYAGKYTLPAVSVLVVTLLLGSVLGVSYVYASRLNKLTAQVETTHQLDNEIYTIASLAHMNEPRIGRHVSPPEEAIHKIQYSAQEVERMLELFQNGKLKLNDEARQHLNPILSVWQEYRRLLPVEGLSVQQSTDALEQLSEYANNTRPLLQNLFQDLNDALLLQSRRTSATAKYLQMAGFLVICIGLGMFLYHFFRQSRLDRQHEAARLETHEILDTLSEGLFLLDKDLTISIQQSKTLQRLLPQIGEGGQNFMELAAELLSDRKKLSSVKMFIEQLYNPRVVEKLIYGLNPLRKVEIPPPPNSLKETRVLGFHFSRVIKDRKISKVLVSVRDLTDSTRVEARLEREQAQNDLQIEMISRMLNADESIMRGFLNTSLKQLGQINTILKNPGNNADDLRDKARLISQEIHSFKGEASVLNMSAFVLAAESFEDILAQMQGRLNQLTGNDFLPLVVELESLLEKVAQAEELHRKMTGRLNNPAPLPVAASATDLGTLFGRFVVNMGYRHNKSVIMETGGLEYLKQECPSFGAIKDIIIQLLRNAVVHGIEPVRVRTLNGKSGEGHIRLNIARHASQIRILVEDDGRGIDLNAVRAKAVEYKIASVEEVTRWSDNQLFALLFRPGFSTLPENNEDAGRGIGMDIVRTRVKKLNGRISLHTEAGKYTRFVITLTDHN